MRLDPRDLKEKDAYKLLIGLVVPRPIAFVTTMNDVGIINAAPFSFFNVVCTDPPMLALAVVRKPDGSMKDTATNVKQTGEFVVHVSEAGLAAEINHTSCAYPPETSEIEKAGLSVLPSHAVKVPRVKECKAAMECRLHSILELGNRPDTDLIIGEIVQFHVDETIYLDGKIKIDQLQPLSRLAGTDYSRIGEVFSLERPVFKQ